MDRYAACSMQATPETHNWYARFVDRGNQRITVDRTVDVASDEGTRFIRYSASYVNRNKPEDNEVEQGHTPHVALENLYQTLERKGYSRETLPKPAWRS